ncbi:unnamed protein product [Mytilus edulis]|uniref:Uncharacterized protein n=1 Tax=Mytilus edulis TaxID=6550 RepID=A0A8S3QCK8_MYTED|nr:unnamed protein product [Mytilus edulis]
MSRQDNRATNETFYIDVEGSLYDSINEEEIYDDNIQIIYSVESTEVVNKITSDSEGSAVESDCSGYLHPYATVIKDFETHTYCKQIKSYDSSSLHSVTDDTDIDSRYTHPYEQLEVENMAEVKSDYGELVHYFELIDITKPASMSKMLSNNSLISNSNDNDQTENDIIALSPLLNKTMIPYIFNRNIIPAHQSLNCKFNQTTHFSSLPTFDQREEKEKIPNLKHMSV